MNIFDTVTLTYIANFFQIFWLDAAGRIFIITFFAYSASYMIYSGYISWFAGGYGGFLLSQVGFTVIDFLSLIPTSILMLFELIKALFRFALRYTLIYIISPFFGLLFFLWLSENWKTHLNPQGIIISMIGFGMWFIGANLGFFQFKNDKKFLFGISILLIVIGTILFSVFIPSDLSTLPQSSPPSTSSSSKSINIFNELTTLMFVFILATSPFIAGLRMAQLATKEKLLSRLTKIILKHPVHVPGMYQKLTNEVEMPPSKLEKLMNLLKPNPRIEPSIFTYDGDSNSPVFLIASFNRITALYISPEALNTERGKMVILANELIYSMEIEGRKKP